MVIFFFFSQWGIHEEGGEMMRSQNAVIVVPFLFITSSDGGGKSLCLSQFSLSGSLQNRQIVFLQKNGRKTIQHRSPLLPYPPNLRNSFFFLLPPSSSQIILLFHHLRDQLAFLVRREGGEAKKLSSFRNVASFLSFFLFPFPRKTVSLKRRQDLRVFP